MSNRRRSDRYAVTLPVVIKGARGSENTLTANVSAHGVAVFSERPFPVRQYVELELKLPPDGQVVNVTAMVARTTEALEDRAGLKHPGVAFDFYLFDTKGRWAWRAFLDRLRTVGAPTVPAVRAAAAPASPARGPSAPAPRVPAPLARVVGQPAPDDEATREEDGAESVAAFLVKPRDIGRLWAFYRTELGTLRVRIETPVLKVVGTPVEVVVVHPVTREEWTLPGRVAVSSENGRGRGPMLEVALTEPGDEGRLAFRRFIASGVPAGGEVAQRPGDEQATQEVRGAALPVAPDDLAQALGLPAPRAETGQIAAEFRRLADARRSAARDVPRAPSVLAEAARSLIGAEASAGPRDDVGARPAAGEPRAGLRGPDARGDAGIGEARATEPAARTRATMDALTRAAEARARGSQDLPVRGDASARGARPSVDAEPAGRRDGGERSDVGAPESTVVDAAPRGPRATGPASDPAAPGRPAKPADAVAAARARPSLELEPRTTKPAAEAAAPARPPRTTIDPGGSEPRPSVEPGRAAIEAVARDVRANLAVGRLPPLPPGAHALPSVSPPPPAARPSAPARPPQPEAPAGRVADVGAAMGSDLRFEPTIPAVHVDALARSTPSRDGDGSPAAQRAGPSPSERAAPEPTAPGTTVTERAARDPHERATVTERALERSAPSAAERAADRAELDASEASANRGAPGSEDRSAIAERAASEAAARATVTERALERPDAAERGAERALTDRPQEGAAPADRAALAGRAANAESGVEHASADRDANAERSGERAASERAPDRAAPERPANADRGANAERPAAAERAPERSIAPERAPATDRAANTERTSERALPAEHAPERAAADRIPERASADRAATADRAGPASAADRTPSTEAHGAADRPTPDTAERATVTERAIERTARPVTDPRAAERAAPASAARASLPSAAPERPARPTRTGDLEPIPAPTDPATPVAGPAPRPRDDSITQGADPPIESPKVPTGDLVLTPDPVGRPARPARGLDIAERLAVAEAPLEGFEPIQPMVVPPPRLRSAPEPDASQPIPLPPASGALIEFVPASVFASMPAPFEPLVSPPSEAHTPPPLRARGVLTSDLAPVEATSDPEVPILAESLLAAPSTDAIPLALPLEEAEAVVAVSVPEPELDRRPTDGPPPAEDSAELVLPATAPEPAPTERPSRLLFAAFFDEYRTARPDTGTVAPQSVPVPVPPPLRGLSSRPIPPPPPPEDEVGFDDDETSDGSSSEDAVDLPGVLLPPVPSPIEAPIADRRPPNVEPSAPAPERARPAARSTRAIASESVGHAAHRSLSTAGSDPALDRDIALARARVVRSPGSVTACYQLGRLLLRRGSADSLLEATEQLHRAVELEPNHPGAHLAAAELAARQGRFDAAAEHLQRARRLGYRIDAQLEKLVMEGRRG